MNSLVSPSGSTNSKQELLNHMNSKRQYFDAKLSQLNVPEDDYEQDSGSESLPQIKQIESEDRHNILQYITHQSLKTKKMQTMNSNFIQFKQGVRSEKNGFGLVWKQGALRIIYLISRFLQVIKTQTSQYKFKLVNRKIMNIIGDNSADFQYYQLNELLNDRPSKIWIMALKFWNKIIPNLNLQIKLGVIQPDHPLRLIFDGLVLFVITLNLFYIPLRISFDLDGFFSSQEGEYILDYLPSIIFIVEIIINFQTSYFEGGIIHEQRMHIVKHYLKGEFIGDFIVVLPFILKPFNIKYIEFVLLLRIIRVVKLVENIEESSSIREKYAIPLDLTKLIFILIFVSHVCACVWNYIGDIEIQAQIPDVWIKRYNMEQATWESRYIICFYWSTITTLTVGYGDLVPGNDYERLVCCLLVLICSIVFGYTISSIGSIFAQFSERKTKFRNNMAQMNHYIKKRKLNKQLQTKVKKYFEYIFNIEQYQNEECELQMNQLSPDLKREVNVDIYLRILQRSSILTKYFNKDFLQLLCSHMHTKKYSPGDLIFRQNDLMKELYFVISGTAEAFVKLQEKTTFLRTYNKGYVFGLKQFMAQTSIEYGCKAIEFTEIAYFDYDSFRLCLLESEVAMESYQLMKDSLTFNNSYKTVSEACPICTFNHHLGRCPFTFFQPNKLKLQNPKDESDSRKKLVRKNRKKIGALETLKDTQMNAIAVGVDNGLFKEEEINFEFEKQLGLVQMNQSIQEQTHTIKSPQNQQSSIYLGDLPSLKIIRQNSKKRSHIEDFKFSKKKLSPQIQDSHQILDFLDKSDSKINMMRQVQQEFKEIIKVDPIIIDVYTNFNMYYKEQNVEKLIKVFNDRITIKKSQRRYRKNLDNQLQIRQQGSFLRGASGTGIQRISSRENNPFPNVLSRFSYAQQDSIMPQ